MNHFFRQQDIIQSIFNYLCVRGDHLDHLIAMNEMLKINKQLVLDPSADPLDFDLEAFFINCEMHNLVEIFVMVQLQIYRHVESDFSPNLGILYKLDLMGLVKICFQDPRLRDLYNYQEELNYMKLSLSNNRDRLLETLFESGLRLEIDDFDFISENGLYSLDHTDARSWAFTMNGFQGIFKRYTLSYLTVNCIETLIKYQAINLKKKSHLTKILDLLSLFLYQSNKSAFIQLGYYLKDQLQNIHLKIYWKIMKGLNHSRGCSKIIAFPARMCHSPAIYQRIISYCNQIEPGFGQKLIDQRNLLLEHRSEYVPDRDITLEIDFFYHLILGLVYEGHDITGSDSKGNLIDYVLSYVSNRCEHMKPGETRGVFAVNSISKIIMKLRKMKVGFFDRHREMLEKDPDNAFYQSILWKI